MPHPTWGNRAFSFHQKIKNQRTKRTAIFAILKKDGIFCSSRLVCLVGTSKRDLRSGKKNKTAGYHHQIYRTPVLLKIVFQNAENMF